MKTASSATATPLRDSLLYRGCALVMLVLGACAAALAAAGAWVVADKVRDL